MVTESCVERRVRENGIEVVVSIGETAFDVCITIQPEADISKKYQCKEFMLKFRMRDNAKKLQEPIRIERKKIRYDKSSAFNNARLIFNTKEYKCEISLVPQFYAREEALLKAKQRQEARKPKPKKISLGNSSGTRTRTFKPIPYSKTNIARPYSGGRCTPK